MSQKIYTNLDIKGNATIGDITNATSDTDKFLVSDAGVVKYRTGSEMLSDLGVAPGVASKIEHQVKASVDINKGQAVYAIPTQDGTNILVGLASNSSEPTSSKTMGLLDNTVPANGFANVVTEGLLAGLNTIGATVGDPVWLGTSGNLIYGLANKPYAPNHLVFIGIVTRVNANNGEIFVKVQNGFELDELHNVDLKTTSPSGNEILAFEGAPVNLWKNKTISSVLGYTPYNASNPAGYTTNTGTVTSVSGTGGYGGLTLSGSVTTSGSLTLGGTPTGTWPIAISGNAATATNADYANSSGYAGNAGTLDGIDSSLFIYGDNSTGTASISDATLNGALKSGFYTVGTGGIPNATGVNFVLHTAYNGVGNAAGFDLACNDSTTSSFYLRPATGGGKGSWQTVVTSANVGSYAVPTSRTITINGTSYDLSANRSWTVTASETDTLATVTGRGATTSSSIGAPNFYDVNVGSYNINLGSGGSEGRGLVAGYSGGSYGGIGYNVRHTTGGGTWIAPGTDTSSYLLFNAGGFNFQGSSSGTAGRTLSYTTLATLGLNGVFTVPGDVRSPIFYDSNDTSYYINPNGDSRLSRTYIGNYTNYMTLGAWDGVNNRIEAIGQPLFLTSYGGSIKFGYQGSTQMELSTAGNVAIGGTPSSYKLDVNGNIRAYMSNLVLDHTGAVGGIQWGVNPYIQGVANGGFEIRDNTSGVSRFNITAGGNVTAEVDMRSPIFYDSNNTGYYVDPNGSSQMSTINAVRFASVMGSQSPDNSHPGFGIRPFYSWNIGQANNSGAGYSNGITIGSNPGDQAYGFQIVQNMWDDQLYFRRYNSGWQGWRTALDNTNYSSYSNFGGNSVYGGIYYDANNTGYYLDPASGSNLYDLALSGGKHTYLYINPGNGYEAMVRYNGGSGNTWYAGKRTTGTAQAGTDGFHFYSDAGGDTVVGFGTDGTIRGKGDVVAYSSSDRQLKDNISPIENALEKVKQIGGYTFDWNNKQTIYEGHDVGVVAQEIESVLPEVVTTRDTGFKAVKYEKIVPLLIEAIKEQSSIIDKLINRIEKLESK